MGELSECRAWLILCCEGGFGGSKVDLHREQCLVRSTEPGSWRCVIQWVTRRRRAAERPWSST